MKRDRKAQVKELSHLCRIKLTSEEEENLEKNLQNILKYMDQIKEIDTEGIPTTTTVLPTLKNVFAEDEEEEPLDREIFLANAPDQMGGMIKVPPIIQFEE